MKKPTLLEEFCTSLNCEEESLAPHVRDCLVHLEGKEFEDICRDINDPIITAAMFEKSDMLVDFKKSVDAKEPTTVEQTKTAIFNILRGVQHSYDRAPYVLPQGMQFLYVLDNMPDPEFCVGCFEHIQGAPRSPRIVVTTAMLKQIATIDTYNLKFDSPFETADMVGNKGFLLGMEEQDHASDTMVRKIQSKQKIFAASKLKNDQYYTQNIEEFTSALRRNDYAVNNKLPWTEKSQKPSDNSLEK